MSSGSDFFVIIGPDDVIDGVLFYARHTEEPLYDSVNINFLLFEGDFLLITSVLLSTILKSLFVGLAQFFYVFNLKIDRNISNKNEINGNFYSSFISIQKIKNLANLQ